jgi:hypothetical protein
VSSAPSARFPRLVARGIPAADPTRGLRLVHASKVFPRARTSFVFVAVVYVSLTQLTSATFMADRSDYSACVAARLGKQYDSVFYSDFFEFGHALWRPCVYSVVRAVQMLNPRFAKSDPRHTVTILLIGISWIAGFATLFLLHRIACHFRRDFWLASLVTFGFATSQGFLNFIHAGTPYIPGLAMIVAAMYVLQTHELRLHPFLKASVSGAAMAGAVLLWFPYALILPAVLFIPLLQRRSWRITLNVSAIFALVCSLAYVTVALHLGLRHMSDILSWIRASNHGIEHIKGVSRAIFGFARSFINMGNDGVLFKRYLLHDPFSPVSLMDLFKASLVKLLLFYCWIGGTLIALAVAKQNRTLLLLIASLAPVIGFAVEWQGGDMERYLAVYPFLFLAVAAALAARSPFSLRYLIVGFIFVMAVVNVFALFRSRVVRHENEVARRLEDIPVDAGDLHRRIWVATNQDEVFNFIASFPFAPVNRDRTFQVSAVFEVGRSDTAEWKVNFSQLTNQVWDRGGVVWLSKRLLSPVPKPEWNWVEGQDRRVSWKQLKQFFSVFELDKCVGAGDGFCLLRPSRANREFLSRFDSKGIAAR